MRAWGEGPPPPRLGLSCTFSQMDSKCIIKEKVDVLNFITGINSVCNCFPTKLMLKFGVAILNTFVYLQPAKICMVGS